MNKKIIKFLLSIVVVVAVLSLGFKGIDDKNKLNKPTINDNFNYIAINQILMYVANNGDGSHDPKTGGNGFYWPGGINATKSAIFEDGFIYGSRIGNEIRVNGNTHRQGLQAGKILPDGKADDPTLPKYRVFKVRKDWKNVTNATWRAAYEKDWNEWPVEDGAPWIDVNKDGKYDPNVDMPDIAGDEMLWYVANDLDASRSTFTYGTNPQGLEFQTSIFGFNRTGPLGNMVFKKYLFINKGNNILNDMIIAYWSDTDLGYANDDYSGCDTVLKLGYTYNASNSDQIYGTPPPSVGYVFFQGPRIPYDKNAYPIINEKNLPDSALFRGTWYKGQTNLPMTAFTFYINGNASYRDPTQGTAAGSIEFYNYLSGKVWNGNPFIDPNTNQVVKYVLSGDPVAKKGWYEGAGFPGGPAPDDRRHVMASGSFKMAPGDTQEVVVGIVIAQGADNLGSVTELKKSAVLAQKAFDVGFNLPPSPPSPILHLMPGNESVTLWWEPNAESYSVQNTIIDPSAPDKFYRFQGYRVWQFRDAAGKDPVVLATFDIKDNIVDIKDVVDVNGVSVTVPIIKLTNDGLGRFFSVDFNKFTNGPLYNGTPYYFGISAFGVNKYSLPSSPEYLESTPAPFEVRPTTPKIDQSYAYNFGNKIQGTKVGAGKGFGKVEFMIIDPEALTGHKYQVIFKGTDSTNLSYDILDVDLNKIVASNLKDFSADSSKKLVVDGFAVTVYNTGKDSLDKVPTSYAPFLIKEVVESKGPAGPLATPIDVINNLNSTKKWKFVATGEVAATASKDQRFNLNWKNAIGLDDYEIRFLTEGADFYVTGYQTLNPLTRADRKGKGKIPFQIWNVGRFPTDTAKQIYVKVFDRVRDSLLTKIDSPKITFEEIFAYQTNTPYPATGVLPNPSETSTYPQHKFGYFSFFGEMPENGTVIKINTFKPLGNGDIFEATIKKSNLNDKDAAKSRLDQISVYPNPYFGANSLERDKYQRFVRFTNLPTTVNIKIFNLAGVFITELRKDGTNPWLDWNLRTRDGLPVSSGVYIAYLDMPGIGTKILKIAVIMETQYIDRL